MVDVIAGGTVFPLPLSSVYAFPEDYPYPGEVYAPVWEGTQRRVPCVAVGGGPTRVLLFHGNGETIVGARELALRIGAACDATVYVMEFPGYWKDAGGHADVRSAKAVYEAAAQTAAIIAEGGGYHLVGYSLGTALAVRVAKQDAALQPRHAVQSLTLIAPICSALSVFATSPAEGLPPGLRSLMALVKPMLAPLDIFCAEKDAPFVRAPSAVVFGTHDEVVANSQGARMATLLHATTRIVAGAGHCDIQGHHSALAFIGAHITEHCGAYKSDVN